MTDEHNRIQTQTPDPKLVGIGGWLILPAIGLVLGPVIEVIGLVVALGLMSDVEDAGYGGVHAINIVAAVGLLAFMVYTATRFFGKKSNAPAVMIAFLAIQLVVLILLLLVELGAGAEEYAVESVKALVRSAIGAAIWIPYFKVSKRVKATFVN